MSRSRTAASASGPSSGVPPTSSRSWSMPSARSRGARLHQVQHPLARGEQTDVQQPGARRSRRRLRGSQGGEGGRVDPVVEDDDAPPPRDATQRLRDGLRDGHDHVGRCQREAEQATMHAGPRPQRHPAAVHVDQEPGSASPRDGAPSRPARRAVTPGASAVCRCTTSQPRAAPQTTRPSLTLRSRFATVALPPCGGVARVRFAKASRCSELNLLHSTMSMNDGIPPCPALPCPPEVRAPSPVPL